MIDAVAFKGKLLQHAVAANVSTHTKNELKSTGANNGINSSCMQISVGDGAWKVFAKALRLPY
jgi:hypothetical protein